jgi:hypothetical protein
VQDQIPPELVQSLPPEVRENLHQP